MRKVERVQRGCGMSTKRMWNEYKEKSGMSTKRKEISTNTNINEELRDTTHTVNTLTTTIT